METKTLIIPIGTKIVSVRYNTDGIHFENISKPLYMNPVPVIHGRSISTYKSTVKPVTVDRWVDFDIENGSH